MHACLLLGGRCVVALVFAVSALAKLRAPGDFASALRAMAVVPRRLNRPVVIAVPLVEAAVALLVWLPGPVATWAFAAAGGLLALFAAVLVSVLWRRIDVHGRAGPQPLRHLGEHLVGQPVQGRPLGPLRLGLGPRGQPLPARDLHLPGRSG
ncbi:MauE/DoxX family redox-associated membrane protein, partial [Kitasatospora sp. NPDC001574]